MAGVRRRALPRAAAVLMMGTVLALALEPAASSKRGETQSGGAPRELTNRVQKLRKSTGLKIEDKVSLDLLALNSMLTNRAYRLRDRLRLFDAVVSASVLNANEAWTITRTKLRNS